MVPPCWPLCCSNSLACCNRRAFVLAVHSSWITRDGLFSFQVLAQLSPPQKAPPHLSHHLPTSPPFPLTPSLQPHRPSHGSFAHPAHFCLRTFAQAIPPAWNILPHDSSLTLGLYPNPSFLEKASLTSPYLKLQPPACPLSSFLNLFHSTYHLTSSIFSLSDFLPVFLIRTSAPRTENLFCLVHHCVPATGTVLAHSRCSIDVC